MRSGAILLCVALIAAGCGGDSRSECQRQIEAGQRFTHPPDPPTDSIIERSDGLVRVTNVVVGEPSEHPVCTFSRSFDAEVVEVVVGSRGPQLVGERLNFIDIDVSSTGIPALVSPTAEEYEVVYVLTTDGRAAAFDVARAQPVVAVLAVTASGELQPMSRFRGRGVSIERVVNALNATGEFPTLTPAELLEQWMLAKGGAGQIPLEAIEAAAEGVG